MTAQTLTVYALWGAITLYAISMVAYSQYLARLADRTTALGGSSAKPASVDIPVAPRPQKPGKAAGIALSTMIVGATLHTVGFAARWVEAGHVPWSTMFEFLMSGSLVAVVTFLFVQRTRDLRFLGAPVAVLVLIALGLGVTVLYSAATGLQPALQSYWLVIHVSIAVIATGVFSIAFLVTMLQLARARRDAGGKVFAGRAAQFLDSIPGVFALEGLAFRLNAVGFVLWTFTVFAGAVWAEHAWGRYWGWDPKEIWSFVIWVIYAAYLHARTTQGWTGSRASVLAISGFVALILNFTLVNLVFQGLHAYSGT